MSSPDPKRVLQRSKLEVLISARHENDETKRHL